MGKDSVFFTKQQDSLVKTYAAIVPYHVQNESSFSKLNLLQSQNGEVVPVSCLHNRIGLFPVANNPNVAYICTFDNIVF